MEMSNWGVTNTENLTIQYCFPDNNLSCSKSIRPEAEYIVVYIFVSVTSVFTVFLNLLVIVSISHFKQLHTPTNVLILSLAVADLIAGLILMPVQGMKLIEPCWYFGEIFCSIFPLILYVVVTASLGNLVIISVDRYIAVNDPLRYPLKVNNKRVVVSIVVNWLFSFVYSFYLLYEYSFVCLVAPCCVIFSLYVKICFVANYQAKQLNSATDKKARSEKKAARTLGIVVLVYLLCWTPYYLATLSFGHDENDALVINIMQWIVCMNSLMNPFIYAMFYRWFRLSAKYILTLKILEPSSENKHTDTVKTVKKESKC
uniref:G-protein coupled receptors family 1 profile domain-containing protein n=1 Tax=Cyprinus carpio TaxID=7962 RepID=A0A8C1TUF4_CYPCA